MPNPDPIAFYQYYWWIWRSTSRIWGAGYIEFFKNWERIWRRASARRWTKSEFFFLQAKLYWKKWPYLLIASHMSFTSDSSMVLRALTVILNVYSGLLEISLSCFTSRSTVFPLPIPTQSISTPLSFISCAMRTALEWSCDSPSEKRTTTLGTSSLSSCWPNICRNFRTKLKYGNERVHGMAK